MIEYIFKLDNGEKYTFEVHLDRCNDTNLITDKHPDWTLLHFNQCTNYPLDKEVHRYCPVALDLEEVVSKFTKVLSFEKVQIEVRTLNRNYHKSLDV